jgi:hypothetical protein
MGGHWPPIFALLLMGMPDYTGNHSVNPIEKISPCFFIIPVSSYKDLIV